MTPAIFYHPEAYKTSGPKLMGRNAAGESFLRGFLRHSRNEQLAIQVGDPDHARSFAELAHTLGRKEPLVVINKTNLGTLSSFGAAYHPGPGIADHANQRSFFDHHAWSLCGITHTTCSPNAMDSITKLITAPIQPWDALICTSLAVKNNVEYLLNKEADYLMHRLGASKVVLPKLPVIPLGVHTDDFIYDAKDRASARQSLEIPDDAAVVLYVGRLSFHAKAHPLPMYVALEEASQRSGKNVVLIECGWHSNQALKDSFKEGASTLSPNIRSIQLDGRNADDRAKAWASADVFCSLSDNIQETFGITPIEAMASGLPVVVSDWDGYKDTVRHNEDGFRIPTTMPKAGLGRDLAFRHALEVDTYDMYIGQTASLIAVDIEATTAAFTALFASKELRYKMGASGQARARERYDWSRIIPQYEDLWANLNEERIRASSTQGIKHSWPARPDPFDAFAFYPTQILTEETKLAATSQDIESLCRRTEDIRSLDMVSFARLVLPTPKEVRMVLKRAVDGPTRAVDLIQNVPKERKPYVFRSLSWLLKVGALCIR